MITLGTQYYRAPFPESRFWDDDLRLMKDSGLNTVQLWVLWGWVEAKQGAYEFGDYDRLVEIAAKHGLGVVLSTIAEIHPYWIHDAVPGSEMITAQGHKVVSSNRGECHFGITPGGCFDHDGVRDRMLAFIRATAGRYGKAAHLRGWDAWNELRWNVQADGLVCHCPQTLKGYRLWLERKHGSLDGLNRAWHRRYGRWEEVLPGKAIDRPYTEMTSFMHFLTERANAHARLRYDTLKAVDGAHPITVHGAQPTPYYAGDMRDPSFVYPLDRGNDWSFAEHIDGIGFSSFPKWSNQDDTTFGVRVSIGASSAAAKGKRIWLSELQGGRSSIGFSEPHFDVDARSQQRWLWNGIAGGADTVLFWCWRDEIFGRESNGFGIIGNDGHRDERIAALKQAGKILVDQEKALAAYKPLAGRVGVWFSPQTYYLFGAQEGRAGRVFEAMEGWCRALTRQNIPYCMVEEEHLDVLSKLSLLIIPKALVLGEAQEAALRAFVENGGTLVCESETGAFNPAGLYAYPEERFLAKFTGVRETGRRRLPMAEGEKLPTPERYTLGGVTAKLRPGQWVTPLSGPGAPIAPHPEGALAVEVAKGKGRVVLLGTFLGENNRDSAELERFTSAIVARAGVEIPAVVDDPLPDGRNFVQVIAGRSNGKRILFAFFPRECRCDAARLRLCGDFSGNGTFKDAVSGNSIPVSGDALEVPNTNLSFAFLVEA